MTTTCAPTDRRLAAEMTADELAAYQVAATAYRAARVRIEEARISRTRRRLGRRPGPQDAHDAASESYAAMRAACRSPEARIRVRMLAAEAAAVEVLAALPGRVGYRQAEAVADMLDRFGAANTSRAREMVERLRTAGFPVEQRGQRGRWHIEGQQNATLGALVRAGLSWKDAVEAADALDGEGDD